MTCTLSGSPDPVANGGILTISVAGAVPGTPIQVKLDNGEGLSEVVTINVGADGKGSTAWPVPPSGWDVVDITSPPCLAAGVIVA